jgi:hypothetical protein
VYNVATDTSPTPAQSCADRVPEYNAPGANPAAFVQCVGSCSALFGSPVAKCQRNATSGQLEWVVTKACYSASECQRLFGLMNMNMHMRGLTA